MTKEKKRQYFKSIRNGLSALLRRSAAQKIRMAMLKLRQIQDAKTMGLYISKGSEVSTRGMIAALVRKGKTVAAPKTGPHQSIVFHRIKKLSDCRKGAYGILEPSKNCPRLPASKLDVILVPGLAFDREGYRLGYGQGYYDRFLSKSNAFKIGLCYERNFTQKLPRDPHDAFVDCVVTEKKTRRIR